MKLDKHGLLQHHGNGVYVITECGQQYLRGNIVTFADAQDERKAAIEFGEKPQGERGENGGWDRRKSLRHVESDRLANVP